MNFPATNVPALNGPAARDIERHICTFFNEGEELFTAFALEPTGLAQRQQTLITEFAN